MTHLTYLEAAVVGLIQGVTELFPISSLGHNVLLPAIIGGSWATDLNVAAPESPYLAFIVGCMGIWFGAFVWMDREEIPVHLLGTITVLCGIVVFGFVYSLTVLVLYGRHMEADDA